MPTEQVGLDGSLHYDTYLQQKAAYARVKQTVFSTPKLRGTEQEFRCCDVTMRYAAQFKRHIVLYHDGKRQNVR